LSLGIAVVAVVAVGAVVAGIAASRGQNEKIKHELRFFTTDYVVYNHILGDT
jgi:hypothetical protein